MSTTQDLSQLFRYITQLTTDKPIYRAGDRVYIRGVILHALTNTPQININRPLEPKLIILSPSGDKISEYILNVPENSVVSCFWDIPADRPGGDYKVKLIFPYDEGFATAERGFNIRSFSSPRLKTQLTFLQKGYGPGNPASACLDVKRAEGGVPQGALVEAVARVDGEEIYRGNYTVDDNGLCIIKFVLPNTISTGEGTLNCTITDGEGGEMVEEIPSRFYFEAFTKIGDPADIIAQVLKITDRGSEVIAEVKTEHEGRGRGTITPERGAKYALRIQTSTL